MMHIPFVKDLQIMPQSWWLNFAVDLSLSGMFYWIGGLLNQPFLYFCAGAVFALGFTHLAVWSIFFAPQQRWLDQERNKLKQLFEENGLTWPE